MWSLFSYFFLFLVSCSLVKSANTEVMEQVLRGGLRAGGWIVGLFLMLSSCGSRKESVPSVEAQVLEAYEQYVLLLDNGISAKMVLELNGEQVSGAITKPTDADLEAFFVHYTENPLCQDAADREAVVACLVDILKDKGCVRLATCADCVYGCED